MSTISISTKRAPADQPRVLIVSASLGAGHNGAAAEWAARLGEAGYAVEIRDLLDVFPAGAGAGMSHTYEALLHRAGWAYELIYRVTAWRPVTWLVAVALMLPFRRRLRRLIASVDPVAVMSTYPLASQLLGRLRLKGQLTVPAATFLTDCSVHPLWVARGIDAHFAVNPVSAGQASRRGATGVVVTGPLVPGRFAPGTSSDRTGVRERFGLPAHDTLALLVAGSWGVGGVEATARDILAAGTATPVVVCGRNEVLRRRIEQAGLGIALGWVSEMPDLLRAVDVLVENAGGLTSLEAMATDLPVLTYRPIPGHGRDNAKALAEQGVTAYVRDRAELAGTLAELVSGPRGARQRREARALFEANPTVAFESVVYSPAAVALPRRVALRRAGVATAMFASVLAGAGTVGTEYAVAHGLGAVRAVHSPDAFVVVHPDASTRFDAQTIRLLQRTHAGVAVDDALLAAQPRAMRSLARAGVPLLNAGGAPFTRGLIKARMNIRSTDRALDALTGRDTELFLAGHGVNALDLGLIRALHERVVVPDAKVTGAPGADEAPGRIVQVNCAASSGCSLDSVLTGALAQARDGGFRLGSLPSLVGR